MTFLAGVPAERILERYAAAPGNEIDSGKLFSPESSAALVANVFGFFLAHPGDLPPLPGSLGCGWPASSVDLEVVVRLPWRGGRHPCLDVLVQTRTHIIGIESKRFEPFRLKSNSSLSDAYWRPVWGSAMTGYQYLRDGLHDGTIRFDRLDAVQLVKHAFGLRSAVHGNPSWQGRKPNLFYIYAEPAHWPDGQVIPKAEIESHRGEINKFNSVVADDEVSSHACSYCEFLSAWAGSPVPEVREHANAVTGYFAP